MGPNLQTLYGAGRAWRGWGADRAFLACLMDWVVATAWRSADRRLSGAQAELALQEESVRRSRRECRATLDQMAVLERSLQATESELRASQVGRSGGPVGAGPRVLCGPLPESQPVGTACGSFQGADSSPMLSVSMHQGEGLGASVRQRVLI